MINMIAALQKSVLCKNMNEEQITNFIKSSSITEKRYNKGSIIFHEMDKPTKLYLLMKGKISICKNTMSGRTILLTEISECGAMFGEVYLYMKKAQYGIYTVVQENAQILEIDSDLFSMERGILDPSHIVVLQNLLMIFATKAFNMNSKLQVLSSGNLRQCLVRLLVNMQQENNVIQLDMTKEAMAQYLNVARQSLSREFSAMQEEGLIQVKGKQIIILRQEGLEEYL
ncbi:MAG: Crp/Fnr family transcriptional regulator [Lachnotalea sp.]